MRSRCGATIAAPERAGCTAPSAALPMTRTGWAGSGAGRGLALPAAGGAERLVVALGGRTRARAAIGASGELRAAAFPSGRFQRLGASISNKAQSNARASTSMAGFGGSSTCCPAAAGDETEPAAPLTGPAAAATLLLESMGTSTGRSVGEDSGLFGDCPWLSAPGQCIVVVDAAATSGKASPFTGRALFPA